MKSRGAQVDMFDEGTWLVLRPRYYRVLEATQFERVPMDRLRIGQAQGFSYPEGERRDPELSVPSDTFDLEVSDTLEIPVGAVVRLSLEVHSP